MYDYTVCDNAYVMSLGTRLARYHRQESLKTLGFCNLDKNDVVDGAPTYLRSSMGQEQFFGLALLHIHYSLKLNLEEIVNIFARQNPRRMVLDLK